MSATPEEIRTRARVIKTALRDTQEKYRNVSRELKAQQDAAREVLHSAIDRFHQDMRQLQADCHPHPYMAENPVQIHPGLFSRCCPTCELQVDVARVATAS